MTVESASAICFDGDRVLDWAAFATDVAALRTELAGVSTVCNLLGDRYQFMVGLAAALLNGQVTVLPPSNAPLALAASLADVGDNAIVLGDLTPPGWQGRHIERLVQATSGAGGAAQPGAMPAALARALREASGEVHVFTSGSTGSPVRHIKRWSTLAGGAAVTDALLQQAGLADIPVGIVGTTPQQHMYGLEATVFMALGFTRPVYRRTVFFPGDLDAAVAAALRAELAAIVLVTSPMHLRYLAPAIAASPEIQLIISATAPLPVAQAADLEADRQRVVLEIYGSTETGSLAGRRTTRDEYWTPMAGFSLDVAADGTWARAPHLETAVPLNDEVELKQGRFRLLGRLGEQLQVAGKRTTLGALNAALVDAPGLRDAVVLRRKVADGDLLAIAAVLDPAAGLTERQARASIRHHLHHRVDAVFVPSRIVFVDALPRSATGKLSAADLEGLARTALG